VDRRLPYRLPQLRAAPADLLVFVVEGEKDANRLASLGLVATCNPGGAGKWRSSFSQFFRPGSPKIVQVPRGHRHGL
jgi:hypothetical protein